MAKRNVIFIFLLLFLVLLVFGCTSSPVCGNGICETGETPENCSIDNGGDCVVENSYPTIVLNSNYDINFTNDTRVSFVFIPSDSDGVVVKCGLNVDDLDDVNNVLYPIEEVENELQYDLNIGSYEWSISCIDDEEAKTISSSKNLVIEAVPNIAPIVSLISPGDDASTVNNNISFVFIPSDSDGVVVGCSLNVDDLDDVNNVLYPVEDVENVLQYDLNIGLHEWSISCEDNDGNETSSDTMRVSIISPTIEFTGSTPNDGAIINSDTVTIDINVNKNLNSCTLLWLESSWVYQEDSNSVSYVPYYIDFNYSIPTNATTNSLWKVKHGVAEDYNVLIPSECFNDGLLQFQFYVNGNNSSRVYHSYGSCRNNLGSFIRITNDSTANRIAGDSCSTKSVTRAYDGQWNTNITYCQSNWRTTGGNARYGDLYEEGMLWNIESNSELAMVTTNNIQDATATYNKSNLMDNSSYSYLVSCSDSSNTIIQTDERSFTIDMG